MSAVAWTHWDEAFLAADKEPEKRLTFTLPAPLYEKALVSLASEHGWLPRSDARYQEACRTGRLEWWDARGRCVVVVREGSDAALLVEQEAKRPKFDPLDPRYVPNPEAFERPAAPAIKAAEERAIVEEQAQFERAAAPLVVGPPPGPPGVDLGPPKVELRETIRAKGKKK